MPLEALLRDVRYALRGLRRTPGFTAVAITTLALAIGANAAIFSVVDALLVRPLPYRDADRIVLMEATREITGAAKPVPQYFTLDAAGRWQQSLRTFDEVAYYDAAGFEVSTRNGSEILSGATVSASFFSMLGGTIVAGQPIQPSNALAPSIVISQRVADRLFAGPAQALGQSLTLNSRAYTIVGVAARSWNVPSDKTDVWASAAFAQTIDPRCCSVRLIGRLKPDVSVTQAEGDVRETSRRLASVDPASFDRLHTTVATLRIEQLGAGRTALLLLWAAVGVVLIIACANLFNLLVTRNVSRCVRSRSGRRSALRADA